MSALAERLEFAPPPQPGMVRAFILAVLAHLVLLAALTWGVNWKRDVQTPAVEAELWASVPQQAAPKPVEVPPPPPVEPRPVPKPEPKAEPQPAPDNRQAEIALAQEKKKREQLAAEQKLQEQKERERAKKLEREKLAAELRKKQLEAQQAQARVTQEEARKLELQRQENLKRMAGLAGATGAPQASGTALQSSGPSASYAARIRARIKPNIVFSDDIAGNPLTDVEVRTAPDGTIVGRRIIKSSGVPRWDEAVLKAIDKTEVLPRNEDGRVPSSLVIGFRPKD
jgi:colicin import membrane protein